MKGAIIQGRYDVVCPPQTAWNLHRAWPGSRLFIIPDAGHAATVSLSSLLSARNLVMLDRNLVRGRSSWRYAMNMPRWNFDGLRFMSILVFQTLIIGAYRICTHTSRRC